ncbi:MAG: uL15 family ribosomal protein [DPANN group archaeon]|nr:50S ribosomal protein L15P [uncultured archaeon]MBS3064252.1 uL15 family ribosomal protein [DPANN group archaeon]
MPVTIRKKSRKKRGSRTHGHGHAKKWRGAGNRGGRGASNKGKRGASRKTKYYALGIKPIGKHGMMRKPAHEFELQPISFRIIEESVDKWLAKSLIAKEKDTYKINLNKLGYGKLLSQGAVTKKLDIVCDKASAKAVEKLQEAGGSCKILKQAEVSEVSK